MIRVHTFGQIHRRFVLIPFEFHKTNIRDSRSYTNDGIVATRRRATDSAPAGYLDINDER